MTERQSAAELVSQSRLTTGKTPVVRCHAFPTVETETQVFADEYLFSAYWTDSHIHHPLSRGRLPRRLSRPCGLEAGLG